MTVEHKFNSILIVSSSPEITARVETAFPLSDKMRLTSEKSSFGMMNGHAAEIAIGHNVVIFETDPDDLNEMDAIARMLKGKQEDAFYVALTDEDVSISKARRLKDIGVDEVLPSTISSHELQMIVDTRLRAPTRLTAAIGASERCKIISVTQARGGIGATTVAVNLALSLAGSNNGFLRKKKNARVALVDLDLQFGNANVFLDIEDNGGFMRLIESETAPDAQYLKGIMTRHSSGIDILAAPVAIAPLTSVSAQLMASLFDVLKTEYDYVVVDLPRAFVDWIEPVIHQTSRLVVVADTSVPSIRHARRLIDFYREANLGLVVELVANRASKPLIRSEALKAAEKVLETKFGHWIPDNPKIARKAIDLGHPVVERHAKSDMGKAFKKLAIAVRADETPSATMTQSVGRTA